MDAVGISERYLELRRSIPSNVKILLACKNASDLQIAELLKLDDPRLLFGENYVQDAERRSVAVPRGRYHLIGHLQGNKVRTAVGLFGTIESVDSLRIAKRISDIACEESAMLDLYIEVNIDANPKQSGFSVDEVDAAVSYIRPLPNVRLAGIMTMGAIEESRKAGAFANAKGLALKHGLLASMGMSADYLLAIENGSDLVRIGRKLV